MGGLSLIHLIGLAVIAAVVVGIVAVVVAVVLALFGRRK
jgi:hypothetical protein